MPTEKLKQALRSANVVGAEKDAAEVIARLFDAPIALVRRILFAANRADLVGVGAVHRELPEDLRTAITAALQAGLARVRCRDYVEGRYSEARVFFRLMVPAEKASLVCNGCPRSLDCVAESLSTPEHCLTGAGPIGQSAIVRPVRIHGDLVTVECNHPQGSFVLNAQDVA